MDDILKTRELEYFIADWTLVPSTGGVFELSVNGRLLFSKKALKRHAEAGELRALIEAEVSKVRPPGFVLPSDD